VYVFLSHPSLLHILSILIPLNFRRVCKIVKRDYELRNVCPSVCLSAQNNSAPTWRIFMKLGIRGFFENLLTELKFRYNLKSIPGISHQDIRKLIIISHRSFLRMKNISDKRCRKNQNIYFCYVILFFENHPVYEIMWQYLVQPEQPLTST
jgi:hypothetical protein